MFALSNGYVGVRGTFDEGRPALSPGVFVNGFHETWPIVHAEEAYGSRAPGQTIVNVPGRDDPPAVRRRRAAVPPDRAAARVRARPRHARRDADARAAVVDGGGKHVLVRTCRLVSLEHRHLMAITYEVMLPTHSAPVVIALAGPQPPGRARATSPGARQTGRSALGNELPSRVLTRWSPSTTADRMLLGYRTANSGMTLGVGVDHVVAERRRARDVRSLSTATVASSCSRRRAARRADPDHQVHHLPVIALGAVGELVDRCARTLDRAVRDGFDALLASQRAHLDRFWDRADVRVDDGPGRSRRGCSRRSAGTSSSSARRRGAPRAPASRPRA